MNYDANTLGRLAAEYVLGTLRGSARRRFAGLLGNSLVARRAVSFWENRLSALALTVQPVQPPPEVWPEIERRLGFVSRRPGVIPVVPADTAAPAAPPVLWQALAAAFAVAFVGLGAWMLTQPPEVTVTTVETPVPVPTPVQPTYVAVVADAMAQPVWLVSAYPDAGTLQARAINVAAPANNQVFELWMLPNGGAAPVSLGLLPTAGDAQLPLDAARIAILANTATLAVSLEPAGGSPTGAPTGPVVYTAPLVGA